MFSFNIRIVHITLVKHRFPWAENFPRKTVVKKFASLLGLGLGLRLRLGQGAIFSGQFSIGRFSQLNRFQRFYIYYMYDYFVIIHGGYIHLLQKYYQDKLSTITSDINQLKVSSKNYIEYWFHTKSFTLRRYTNIR